MANIKNKHQLWRHYERHPLSAEYEDLTGVQRQRLYDSIKTHGFDIMKPIILAEHNGKLKVLDGWQRQTICVELDVRPAYDGVPTNMTNEQLVEQANDARRHESAEQEAKRMAKRKERVVQGRAENKSIRQIAKEEGVSVGTVHRDIQEASGVQRGTPEPSETQGKPHIDPPKQPKTVGQDGKTYPAAKPVSEDSTKVKAGKIRFDDKVILEPYGKLVRALDARATALGKGDLPHGAGARDDQEGLRERLSKVANARTRLDRCQELAGALLEELKLWRAG